jgi:hypothetical protein
MVDFNLEEIDFSTISSDVLPVGSYRFLITEIEIKDTKDGIAINMSHINHLRAKKLLFSILEENIERWWD